MKEETSLPENVWFQWRRSVFVKIDGQWDLHARRYGHKKVFWVWIVKSQGGGIEYSGSSASRNKAMRTAEQILRDIRNLTVVEFTRRYDIYDEMSAALNTLKQSYQSFGKSPE